MCICKEDERILEFNRLIDWANSNKNTWDSVIRTLNSDNALKDETFINIVRQLKDNQFYQIIFMMFQGSNNFDIGEAVERATLITLSKQINKSNVDSYIDLVIDNFIEVKRNSK